MFPYLLRGLAVDRPDHVWCADITYIPMKRGFAYLVVIMDWATRAVLDWEVSNTLDADFCIKTLRRALSRSSRKPEIFNTDQGCQFTSEAWIDTLQSTGVRVSMDGKGRWLDNVFIERLWRTVKYEDVYLREYEDLEALRIGLDRWFHRYNRERPHSALGGLTPWEAYRGEAHDAAA